MRSAPSRAATRLQDAERLVEVEVTDVGTDLGRPGQPDLRIHVGAVHVDLPAVACDLADLADRRLEHAVGRG